MLVMVLLAAYGYLMPYKQRTANWLEVIILVDFLILLLLRNNPILQEILSNFPAPTNATCLPLSTTAITHFAALLSPLYYLPLLIGCCAIVVWIIHRLLQMKTKKNLHVSSLQCVINEDPYDRVFTVGYPGVITNDKRPSVTEIRMEEGVS